MAAALALSQRGIGRTGSNPSVGCIIAKDDRIIARGWTQPGGRPHAEAMAIQAAKDSGFDTLQGCTVYTTLEPCAHISERGPACSDLLCAASPDRVVIACTDVDPRTMSKGAARLAASGITVDTDSALALAGADAMAGYIMRQTQGRPYVTLKLATSLDGAIAMANGESKWITGEHARAHGHLERARSDAILVGSGTFRTDSPALNVRIAGLEDRSPRPIILTRNADFTPPPGWQCIHSPADISTLDCNTVLIEGGAGAASAFFSAGLVDRILLYRAPILIGGGTPCLNDIGLTQLAGAHGLWQLKDKRQLGIDMLEIYTRNSK
jgi:diaminohydroxyphosphoribosylaminopyrimidine deaminase / 5-amino-6-(5-phosphoribosylamino)uracil reductase